MNFSWIQVRDFKTSLFARLYQIFAIAFFTILILLRTKRKMDAHRKNLIYGNLFYLNWLWYDNFFADIHKTFLPWIYLWRHAGQFYCKYILRTSILNDTLWYNIEKISQIFRTFKIYNLIFVIGGNWFYWIQWKSCQSKFLTLHQSISAQWIHASHTGRGQCLPGLRHVRQAFHKG